MLIFGVICMITSRQCCCIIYLLQTLIFNVSFCYYSSPSPVHFFPSKTKIADFFIEEHCRNLFQKIHQFFNLFCLFVYRLALTHSPSVFALVIFYCLFIFFLFLIIFGFPRQQYSDKYTFACLCVFSSIYVIDCVMLMNSRCLTF